MRLFGNQIQQLYGQLVLNGVAGAGLNPLQINTLASIAGINMSGPATAQLNAVQFQQSGQTSWLIYQPSGSNDIRFFGNGADRMILANNNTGVTFSGAVTCSGITNTGAVTSTGQHTFTDTVGTQWGAPTGGAQGSGTINVSGGYFINGIKATPIIAVSASTVSRASSVTVSNDTNLVLALPAAGTYQFVIAALVNGSGGGIQYAVNYSASFTSSASAYTDVDSLSIVFQPNSPGTILNNSNTSSIVRTAGNVGASQGMIYIQGTITVTAAGTLGFSWGQSTSNATPTTTNPGSYMIATRLA